MQLFVQLIITRFLSSPECVSTLLDLSFSFPFPRCLFPVELHFSHYQSGQSAIRHNNLWLMMQRWMPFPANSKLFCHKPSSGSLTSIFIGRRHHSGMTAFTPTLTTCSFFQDYILFKWINRVHIFVRFLGNLAKMIVGYRCTKVSGFSKIWNIFILTHLCVSRNGKFIIGPLQSLFSRKLLGKS